MIVCGQELPFGPAAVDGVVVLEVGSELFFDFRGQGVAGLQHEARDAVNRRVSVNQPAAVAVDRCDSPPCIGVDQLDESEHERVPSRKSVARFPPSPVGIAAPDAGYRLRSVSPARFVRIKGDPL